MESALRIPFQRSIQNYLLTQKYTHTYNRGHEIDDKDSNDYFIIPLKEEDLQFYDKNNPAIDLMGSDDMYEMADGIEFINFIILVPATVYENFLNRVN